MADDEDTDLELLLASLILIYQESLLKGVTQATLEAYFKAAEDLNIARINAGREVIPIDEGKLTEDALRQVESWYSDLVEKGGSNVVVDHERLEFKPWLSDLENDIGSELKDIYSDVKTQTEIEDIISNLESKFYDRADIAAFCEIYRNADKAKKSVWADERVIRHAYEPNICSYCDELDGQVFQADDCPPCPSHKKCKCDYELMFI